MQLAQVVARALVVLLIAIAVPAASLGANMALRPLPKNPLLFQLNTRVLMDEIKATKKGATLDDFPDEFLDRVASEGYDFVYFLGVWQTGDFGMKKSIKLLDLEPCMKAHDLSILGADFGGDAALLRLRERCNKKGLRLMVDFVPNHMAVDHPWTKDRPELLIQGSENSLKHSPQNFFKVGDNVFAHGKDMYYDGWEDTVQINYGNPMAREEMCNILKKIAGLADGVRCDMAMLICEDVLDKTWGGRLAPFGQTKASGQFWPGAIKGSREVNPDFCYVAECYWDREYELQKFGFDFCYDKTLYDRLKEKDVGAVQGHLSANMDYQKKLVRFLENHDEERAADSWEYYKTNLAAAAISFTIPGLHFVHDGQQEGRTRRISMHVNRRVALKDDVKDPRVAEGYKNLIKALNTEAIRNGDFHRCQVTPSGDGNPSYERIIAHAHILGHQIVLTVVNFSEHVSNGHVIIPEAPFGVLKGSKHKLVDGLSDLVLEKTGANLLGADNGVWLSMEPWTAHIFTIQKKAL